MRELLAAVAVTLAGHVLCAAPVEWTFPRNGGCHEGLAFADGVTGVLVWGGGDTVNLTVGRADLWDHRGGCEWRDEWNYTNIVSRARQGDRAGLAALFKMEVKPGEPKNPQLLPLGRLVVRIPGAILRRGTLDPKTGLGSLVYETEKGLQTADLAMGRTSHAFVIRFPDDTGCEVKTVPSMEHAGLRDHLTSVGVDLPEQWRDDASGGFMWKLPVDDPVSLGWGLRGRELSVRTARTFERLSCCMTYDQVRGESLAQWKLFWERSAHVNVPDETLQQIYEYGLYRFGAMTDPEGVPAGLQGPWLEDDKLIPWNGDYHFNVNVQECYSPAFRSGHPERLLPLFRMIRTWWPRLRENARKFCGVEDGYMLPHAVDDRGTCIGGFWSGTIDHASTVWVADMMYRYAKYARDEAFLRTDAFPFMRGAMNVYLAMMEETADGKLCFPLGSSPEWGAMDGILVGYNPSFQLAAAHRLAKNLIEAAGRIGEPVDSRWSDVERRLPPYTASDGDGIQIFRDVGLKQSHRHHSHMAGLYPFNTLDLEEEKTSGIVQRTYFKWVEMGTGWWSGWSVPWASILHTHIGNPDMAVDTLRAWKKYFTNEGHGSRHDVYRPGFSVMTRKFGDGRFGRIGDLPGEEIMQMDGMCGAVAAILELMAHEVGGKSFWFRGCPDAWQDVSFDNVLTADGTRVGGRRLDGVATVSQEPDSREWEDPSRQALNRLPQHAWFGSFPDVESAKRILSSESPRTLSLDSDDDWRFAWCRRPSERPIGFQRPDYDVSHWTTVKVPCSWQADGIRRSGGRFDTPVYINQPYLFTSEFPAPTNAWPRVTGQPIPSDWTFAPEDNPVGCYRRDFELPADWVGDEIHLQFDGVESFFYLWVNGTYVGFAKDSRAVAAFDVTHLVRSGRNTVALEVYRHCDGSYLECQDTFRLSGIIRPVSLRRVPKTHLADVTLVTEPVVRGAYDGDWRVRLSILVAGGEPRDLCARVFDSEDREVPFEGVVSPSCELTFRKPKTWSAECPNLYKLVVSLEDDGRVTEAAGFQLGFRQVEITDPPRQCDRTFLFNGKPIKMKGVNRGECDPLYGHHVPDSRLEQDLMLIKRGNFNHIRNSHFPQGERFYYLCNKLGIYVMDEANVESHGSQYGDRSPSWSKLWLPSHLARMESMLERNKNHPCVVIWSMGNEAGPGDVFKDCYDYLKRRDPTRPVQYERNNWLTDMGSRQYPWVSWVQRCAAGDPTLTDNVFEKDRPVRYPYHINEYAHNYNNASGNLGDFQAAIESSDRIMGGAVWDWADQTLLTTADGRRVYGWGGTWREKPEEGQGILDGIVTGDRRPEPSYYEAQHVFQNFSAKLSEDGGRIVLANKHYFRSSADFDCRLIRLRDGRPCGTPEMLAIDLPPQGRCEVPLPPGCDAVRVEFALKKPEGVWPAGWVVARDQVDLPRSPRAFVPPGGEARLVSDAADRVSVRTGDWTYSFSRQTGELVSRRRGVSESGETLLSPMTLDAFRMPVGGETFYREGPMYFGRERARDGLACLRPELQNLEAVERDADGACVVRTTIRYRGSSKLDFPRYGHDLHTEILDFGPVDADAPGYEVTSDWRFYGRGVVRLTSTFRQFGRPTKVSRLGWRFVLNAPKTEVHYFARGPVDNYSDRPSGTFKGRYTGWSDAFGGDYSASQDTGCREQAEEVELTVPGLKISAVGRPFSFQVTPYAPLELVREPHPEFMPKPTKTELGVYAAVRGLGSANCGPPPLPCHEIDPTKIQTLDVVIKSSER